MGNGIKKTSNDMSSRDRILDTVKRNQPDHRELPAVPGSAGEKTDADLAKQFTGMLETIGGTAYIVSGYGRIISILKEFFHDARRIVSNCPELSGYAETPVQFDDAHLLENVDLAVLRAHFGVAENASCWITEDLMIETALPFIAQHLAIVLSASTILPTMHDAYNRIGGPETGFGVFIAGPSKTADIEQSLVLGAQGAKSLTIFLLP